jgi:hypothetical protein
MRSRRGRFTVTALGWAATAAGATGLLLHYGTWAWRPLVLLTAVASYLIIATVVGAVLLLAGRRWFSAAVAAAVLAAAVWAQARQLSNRR